MKIVLAALGTAVLIYGLTAYILLPRAWTHYEHQKGLAGLTMVTHTSQGIPGDAINVGLVGTREDVLCAMHAAGWYPADPNHVSLKCRNCRQRRPAPTVQGRAGEPALLPGQTSGSCV